MDLKLMLEENRNKNSVNTDFYQKLNFKRNSMVIPMSDIKSTINTYTVFETERNACTKYRLNITLNPIMSNVLTNKLTEIKKISDGTLLTTGTTPTRLEAIQTIDDYKYEYKLGYDIFDNNFLRIDTFKTGSTLNSFTGKQLYDVTTIEKSVSNNITEDNGWACITNITKINSVKMFPNRKACEKIDLFPTRDYLLFKPNYITNGIKDNWDYTLTYPYENYANDVLVNDESGINGIPINNSSIVSYNGNKYLSITTIYKHGLSYNDVIKLKIESSGDTNTYSVNSVGDINTNNKEYSFLLDIDKYSNLTGYSENLDIRVVRVVNNTDSEYYIRKFKKIPNFTDESITITDNNVDDMEANAKTKFLCETYQPAFSRNIYNDAIYQFQYIDDIDINLLKDNLGRPLSEIYFTIIKKNIIDDSENEPSSVFTEIMSGIDEITGYTGPTNYSNIRLVNGIDNAETPLENMVTLTGSTINGTGMTDSFLGDIVEYNKSTVKEIILDDVKYRFNTMQREETNDFVYNEIYGDEANLLINSNINNGAINWHGNYASVSASSSTDTVDGDIVNYLIISGHTGVNNTGCFNNQGLIYEKGKTYWITFYARAMQLGVSLDKVGVEDTIEFTGNTYSFSLTTKWERYKMSFTGDGRIHNIDFYSTQVNTIPFYITKVKVERNNSFSNWTIDPIEGDYKFIPKTVPMNAFKEGYMYKPHYKMQLKNYSKVISNGELPELKSCDKYFSGDTEGSLSLKLDSIEGLHNFDRVRITKNDTKKYINVKIKLSSIYENTIFIPYDSTFFNNLLISNYTIRQYGSSSIPSYCQDTYDGNCLWREILSEGVFDSESINTTEYTFTNGRLYASGFFNFYLKRQDPFGYYNMRSEVFPADSYGTVDSTTITNNVVQKSSDVC
jgi:hypothetical protein